MTYTLRELVRLSEHRKFLAKHVTNRQAELLGFGPGGEVLGWWVGTDDVIAFPADEAAWSGLVTYV